MPMAWIPEPQVAVQRAPGLNLRALASMATHAKVCASLLGLLAPRPLLKRSGSTMDAVLRTIR